MAFQGPGKQRLGRHNGRTMRILNARLQPSASPSIGPAASQANRIVPFLKGKHIMVTGATGFLGKVVVDKILRVQPDVGGIHLLVQPKQGVAAEDRLSQVVDVPLFGTLKQTMGQANFKELVNTKLHVVPGTLTADNLGVECELLERLQNELNLVIHSAANTNFPERFDTSVKCNTLGAQNVARFAATCPNIESMVHVSTVFVNGRRRGLVPESSFTWNRSVADELADSGIIQHEPPPLNIEHEVQLALSTGAQLGNIASQQLGIQQAQLYGWDQVYQLTKSMGEMLVQEECRKAGLPLAIVRPSIVLASLLDPMSGWVEGVKALDLFIQAYGQGWLPGLPGSRPDAVLDIIPVDYVANAIIAASYQAGVSRSATPSIYHAASSAVGKPCTYANIVAAMSDHFKHTPMIDRVVSVPHSDCVFFDKETWMQALDQLPPGIRRKAARLISVYEPFTSYSHQYGSHNLQALHSSLLPEEQAMFGFDLKGMDWEAFIRDVHIPGLRAHLASVAKV